MKLRAATADDLGFIRSLTTNPANMPFMGDDDEAQLALDMAHPARRLLIWQGNSGPEGFALFREISDPSGRVELFRLALAMSGAGRGAIFVDALIDYAFLELAAKRLWLDASSENPRALKVYERAGFTEEGRLRAHWYRPILGRCVDLIFYGMLRGEWRARRG